MATKKKKMASAPVQSVAGTSTRRWCLIGVAVLGVIAGAYAHKMYQAQAEGDVMPPIVAHVSDEQAIDMMTMARKVLPTLRTAGGALVGEETAAEKARDIVPLADGDRAINTGFISAIAQHCGMAWKGNYDGLLSHYRGEGYTEKQLVFMGFLHNFAMGQFADRLDYSCSPAAKAEIKRSLFK